MDRIMETLRSKVQTPNERHIIFTYLFNSFVKLQTFSTRSIFKDTDYLSHFKILIVIFRIKSNIFTSIKIT